METKASPLFNRDNTPNYERLRETQKALSNWKSVIRKEQPKDRDYEHQGAESESNHRSRRSEDDTESAPSGYEPIKREKKPRHDPYGRQSYIENQRPSEYPGLSNRQKLVHPEYPALSAIKIKSNNYLPSPTQTRYSNIPPPPEIPSGLVLKRQDGYQQSPTPRRYPNIPPPPEVPSGLILKQQVGYQQSPTPRRYPNITPPPDIPSGLVLKRPVGY